jgi:hypothetical protein
MWMPFGLISSGVPDGYLGIYAICGFDCSPTGPAVPEPDNTKVKGQRAKVKGGVQVKVSGAGPRCGFTTRPSARERAMILGDTVKAGPSRLDAQKMAFVDAYYEQLLSH